MRLGSGWCVSAYRLADMTQSATNETAALLPRWGECAQDTQDVLLILCAVSAEARISATVV